MDIVYDFPLNTRKGFRTIYYLMKVTNQDMIKVIKGIISVRHDSIRYILDRCEKRCKENVAINNILYGED